MDRKQLKDSAKQSLRNCRSFNPYVLTLIYFVVESLLSGINRLAGDGITAKAVYVAVSLVNMGICYGYSWWALSVARDNDNKDEFKLAFNQYAPVFIASLAAGIITAVGFVLFVVPGIIASIGLTMTAYCLRDNIEEGGWAAVKASWEMMKGHKAEFFVLGLSFIPWVLLMFVTCGIAGIYVIPYISVTYAKFYDGIKGGSGLN